ncbi:PAS domain-containing protein, partial [Mycobacterium tuberculosis]|nr:PAS domain-containing protein [Mycobacterium tuberculosis]
SEARFRSLFALSPVGMALVDMASGHLLMHSPALAKMLGRDLDPSAPLALADLIADAPPALADLSETSRLAPTECALARADGTTLRNLNPDHAQS